MFSYAFIYSSNSSFIFTSSVYEFLPLSSGQLFLFFFIIFYCRIDSSISSLQNFYTFSCFAVEDDSLPTLCNTVLSASASLAQDFHTIPVHLNDWSFYEETEDTFVTFLSAGPVSLASELLISTGSQGNLICSFRLPFAFLPLALPTFHLATYHYPYKCTWDIVRDFSSSSTFPHILPYIHILVSEFLNGLGYLPLTFSPGAPSRTTQKRLVFITFCGSS